MPFIRVSNLLNRPVVLQNAQTRFSATIAPNGTYENVLPQNIFDALLPTLQRLKLTGQILWDATFYAADLIPAESSGVGLPLRWRGPWDSMTTYAPNDAVQFLDINGGLPALISSFICLSSNINVPPLDQSGTPSGSWTYLAQRGANGAGDSGAYTPANPAQWTNPTPTTQQGAIDRIATMLSLHVFDGSPLPVAGSFTWANPQPATMAAQLDRLAAVVYSVLLDNTSIPAAGSYSWASPTPVTIADQIARLAFAIYTDVLSGNPIP